MNLRRTFVALSLTFLLFYSCQGGQELRPGTTDSSDVNILTFSNVERAQKHCSGSGVKVGVIDWQFDLSISAVDKYVDAASMVPGEEIGKMKPWHGEWMAELVHSVAPRAKIIPINARSLKTKKYEEYLIRGIRYAADQGAVAVSSSMGPLRQCKELDEAIEYAEERGMVFVDVHPEYVIDADGKERTCSKAELNDRILHTGVVSVPAHPVSPDSSRDICTWPYEIKAQYQDGWGFSNAPPIVVGVIALMKSANSSLTPRDIRSIIAQSFRESGGFRVLDAEAAVKLALGKSVK
jgi:subtilisin family serine protease